MPNLKLTNLASYKAYAADLALKHKEITGYRWGDKSIIKNDNRSSLPENVLWATPYDGVKYSDNLSDNIQKTKLARLAFLVPSARQNDFQSEDALFEYCEGIMEQVLAKIIKDKAGQMVGTEWTMLVTNLNTVTGGPVEMIVGSTKWLGWELRLNFMDNTNLAYDATNWDS